MKKAILSLILILSMSACSMDKQSMGLGRQTPDEFVVMKRQPLSMPPDYNLSPPEPGKEPLKQPAPEKDAEIAVFGAIDEEQSSISETDDNFLREIGADYSQPNIRATLDNEMINDPANNKYLIDGLMFWKDKDNSIILDNLEESKRIKHNKKQGLAIDQGEVPVLNPID